MGAGAGVALFAAIAYGASDFLAGVASRRSSALLTTSIALAIELAMSCLAVWFFHGHGASANTLTREAISGIGSAAGTLALYHGFAVGRMSVVATLSGVLTVVIPAVVGLLLGNRLPVLSLGGIVAAVPAIALVCWSPNGLPARSPQPARNGAVFGVIAGLSFALLFIALDRAGTASGAWPLIPGQAVACLIVLPVALRGLRRPDRPSRGAVVPAVIAAVVGGLAGLAYLAATGLGQLAVIAVLAAMYPAVTVLLARIVLGERWSRRQAAGMVVAGIAVLVIAMG
jgi:drug/metabolite transporter (DMT)-like permease